MQAPPKPAKVKIEGMQAVALTKSVTVLRGICNERLKVDVEYNLKRGTTDNSYLIKVLTLDQVQTLCMSHVLKSKAGTIRIIQAGRDVRGCGLLYMPEHTKMVWTSPSHCAPHVQDGDALILIDVPDENFSDAYGKDHCFAVLPCELLSCTELIIVS